MQPRPRCAPSGVLQSKFLKNRTEAAKEMEAWILKDQDRLAKQEASRMTGQLIDNVTEDRMLKAKLWELSKERYKFLMQNAYEKKLFTDRVQRKASVLLRRCNSSASPARSGTPWTGLQGSQQRGRSAGAPEPGLGPDDARLRLTHLLAQLGPAPSKNQAKIASGGAGEGSVLEEGSIGRISGLEKNFSKVLQTNDRKPFHEFLHQQEAGPAVSAVGEGIGGGRRHDGGRRLRVRLELGNVLPDSPTRVGAAVSQNYNQSKVDITEQQQSSPTASRQHSPHVSSPNLLGPSSVKLNRLSRNAGASEAERSKHGSAERELDDGARAAGVDRTAAGLPQSNSVVQDPRDSQRRVFRSSTTHHHKDDQVAESAAPGSLPLLRAVDSLGSAIMPPVTNSETGSVLSDLKTASVGTTSVAKSGGKHIRSTVSFSGRRRRAPSRSGSAEESKTRDPRYVQLEQSLAPVHVRHQRAHQVLDYTHHQQRDAGKIQDVKAIVETFDSLHIPPKNRAEAKPRTELKALQYMKEKGFVF